MKKVVIEGMSCGHCKARVEKSLIELDGITAAIVDLDTKTATIEGDASDDAIRDAIDDAGYDVVSIS
ncbi:heavy-metal-associated domain-containing protein [Clostridium sp. 'White wine YQ']|uniref:heavy-metal-associated domain-containing protein n=1 Tax=Clostridium sp. 'White wine YQ' TaxID=3027474 RepID=UPI0023654A0A|nr:cation transporter [Clostridium sp. 'White wine YQ']MDD7794794.1 cation transporter [Clostridium sp. 'White wine YQ']